MEKEVSFTINSKKYTCEELKNVVMTKLRLFFQLCYYEILLIVACKCGYLLTLLLVFIDNRSSTACAVMLNCVCIFCCLSGFIVMSIPRSRQRARQILICLILCLHIILLFFLYASRNVVMRYDCTEKDLDFEVKMSPLQFSYVIILYGEHREAYLEKLKKIEKFKLYVENTDDAKPLYTAMEKNPYGNFSGYVYKHICTTEIDQVETKKHWRFRNILTSSYEKNKK